MAPRNWLEHRLRWDSLRPDSPCPSIAVRKCIPYDRVPFNSQSSSYPTPTDIDIGINAAPNMLRFDLVNPHFYNILPLLSTHIPPSFRSSYPTSTTGAAQLCLLASYSTEDRAGIRIGKHPAMLTRQLRGFLISYSTDDSAGSRIGKHPAGLARQLRGFLISYSTEDRAGITIGFASESLHSVRYYIILPILPAQLLTSRLCATHFERVSDTSGDRISVVLDFL
ncbi:hypothetical protein B0H14DRAFT_2565805 [Mycena olivaceomarginata]|nr:hypothetical protein B0H14DRAFT_2565805 [Mycena olivaceomarginata]